MALHPGDRVTLTLNPTIRLSRFDSIRPFVSIQREMGPDPAADLAALEAEVHAQFVRALAREIHVLDEVTDALGEGGSLADLAAWCQKEMGNGIATHPTRQVHEAGAAEGAEARRAPVRRPVAKAKPRP